MNCNPTIDHKQPKSKEKHLYSILTNPIQWFSRTTSIYLHKNNTPNHNINSSITFMNMIYIIWAN
jgi:hypothetical protein